MKLASSEISSRSTFGNVAEGGSFRVKISVSASPIRIPSFVHEKVRLGRKKST